MTDEPTERGSLGLLSLPYFILIDAIIPLVSAQDVARLRLVSRATKTIVDDELIWKRFIIEDFNFPSHASARVTGWQQLYRGLARPQLYTWGQSANCRLGVPPSELPEDVRILIMRHQGAPFPIPVDTRGVSAPQSSQSAVDKEEASAVVEVVAGGWSFHALTRTGQILCWGQLDGDSFVDDGSPSSSGHRVQKPIVLKRSVDEPVKSISCGRRHGVALTSKQDVLEWHSWKVAARHNRLIDVGGEVGAASYKIVQLEAGWDFSVILMHDTQQASSRPTTSDTASSSTILYWHTEWVQTDAEDSGKVYDAPKIALPPLPEPSEEVGLELSDCDAAAHCHVIQVAGGEDYVVALTASGLVYKIVLPRFHMPHQSDPSSQHPSTRLSAACRNGTASWQLMEHFCLPSKIGRLPYFQNDGGERVQQLVHPGLRIKHISAQFRTWVAYTVASAGAEGTASDEGGIVLLGKGDGVSETGPEVKHELQDAGVIKVSVGDWHCGALTASGKVMTWGQWSNGALGAWDSLPLLRPPQPSTQRSFQPQPEVDNPLPRTNPFTRFRIGLAGARLRSEQSNSVPPQPAPSARPRTQPAETGSSNDPSAQPAPASEADAQQLRLADRIIPFQGINAPTRVHFDAHKSDRSFVFDIAFAGKCGLIGPPPIWLILTPPSPAS